MKIGTDVSLAECRREGYMIMEFPKRELFIKGCFQPDVSVRFYKYLPDYMADDKFQKPCLDVYRSANDLWESYQLNSTEIDSCSGMKNRIFPCDEYEMLRLADDIDGYKGLE